MEQANSHAPAASATVSDSPVAPLPVDAPWWARWLVADVKQAWRWGSVRWPAICVVGCEVYARYGEQLVAYIPLLWRPRLLAAVFIVSAILRVVNFSKGQQ